MLSSFITLAGFLVVTSILLFFFKIKDKNFLLKSFIIIGRFSVVILLLISIFIVTFPKYFSKISNLYIENSYNIPIIAYEDVEKILVKYKKTDSLGFIEKTQTGFILIDKNMGNIRILDDIASRLILSDNHIMNIDFRSDAFLIFDFDNNENSLGFSQSGFQDKKIGDFIGTGKFKERLNEKWIFIRDCNRNTCPELSN